MSAEDTWREIKLYKEGKAGFYSSPFFVTVPITKNKWLRNRHNIGQGLQTFYAMRANSTELGLHAVKIKLIAQN